MSEALTALTLPTRTFLQTALGTEWESRREPFRESAGLEGHWLGAFAQPAVLLNTVSATELILDAQCNGSARDEYGQARIVGLRVSPDQVTFEKIYNGQVFVYVGGRQGPEITGYWYAKKLPKFAGVFSLTRSDCMTEKSAEEIRASIEKRAKTKMRDFMRMASVPGALGVMILASMIGPLWILLASAILVFLLLRSRRMLAQRIAPLRAALGSDTPL